MSDVIRPCWCRNAALAPYSEHYRHCGECGTLVSTFEHATDVSRVQTDEKGLYGRNYWFSHQVQDLGFPDIYDRARSDLTDRAPYWLRTLLNYKLPPGPVLELGSGHGGFVALLRWAGFDASGLELSPAVAAISRELFHVPMLQGPIEDHDRKPGSLSVIALMDVLEHLPAPNQTMGACLDLLDTSGFLLVQTPKFPDAQSFDDLVRSGHRFAEMLQEQEHLYLFSERSVQRFFSELGANHVTFEPAYFSDYDMFLTVSRTPLEKIGRSEWESRVLRAPAGRAVVALLDLHERLEDTVPREMLAAIEADRAARLEIIEQQGVSLGEVRRELAAQQAKSDALQSALRTSEADRAARLGIIEQQGVSLSGAQQALTAEMARAGALASALRASEADRAARLTLLEEQDLSLGEVRQKLAAQEARAEALESGLRTSEADRAARFAVIEQQGVELAEAQQALAAQKARADALDSALRASEADRAARIVLIEQQADQLGRAQHDAALLRGERDGLRSAYEFSESDRAARLVLLEQQAATASAAAQTVAVLREERDSLRAAYESSESDRTAGLALLEQQRIDLGTVRDQFEAQGAQLAEQRAQQVAAAADLAAARTEAERRAEELTLLRTALANAEQRAARSLTRQVLDKWTQRRTRT